MIYQTSLVKPSLLFQLASWSLEPWIRKHRQIRTRFRTQIAPGKLSFYACQWKAVAEKCEFKHLEGRCLDYGPVMHERRGMTARWLPLQSQGSNWSVPARAAFEQTSSTNRYQLGVYPEHWKWGQILSIIRHEDSSEVNWPQNRLCCKISQGPTLSSTNLVDKL